MYDASKMRWWDQPRNDAHNQIIEHVSEVERAQSFLYDRFYRHDCLYDPYHDRLNGADVYQPGQGLQSDSRVAENVVASNVDTAHAIVATTEVLSRFVTDGAPWSVQRRARKLSLYGEGLDKLLSLHKLGADVFKVGCLKGTAEAKICPDFKAKKIVAQLVRPDDIIVDEGECRNGGQPRQKHHRMIVDREVLKAYYPGHDAEIDSAEVRGDAAGAYRLWAGYRPIEEHQLVVIESWLLPVGKKGSKHFIPGRHTIVTEGVTLLDEEWDEPFFPFAKFVWSERWGYYGIGIGERVAGWQRLINKLNWQIDRSIDQRASPTTYVRPADAGLTVMTDQKYGRKAVYTGEKPFHDIPPAVSGEVYARLDRASAKSFEETGTNQMAARGTHPSGIESGAAIREHTAATTQRFAHPEMAFQALRLDMTRLAIWAAKKLGADAPKILRNAYRGLEELDLSEIDLDELKLQMEASSALSRTPAGRVQSILEQAQAGLISTDEARWQLRPMSPLDLEASMSSYTQALDYIEKCIEAVLDGNFDVWPSQYTNLPLWVTRFQGALQEAEMAGAPEDVLEHLRDVINAAADMINPPQPAPAPADPMAAAPMDPMAPPMDPMAPAAPPQAALAPQAMDLIAG